MLVEVLQSKIHRATVTEANLNYVGSITIDEALLIAARIAEYQKVQIVNVNNGERIETYVVKGRKGSGVVCLNGPAARKAEVGDVIIVIAYGLLEDSELKGHSPTIVFPDSANRL